MWLLILSLVRRCILVLSRSVQYSAAAFDQGRQAFNNSRSANTASMHIHVRILFLTVKDFVNVSISRHYSR